LASGEGATCPFERIWRWWAKSGFSPSTIIHFLCPLLNAGRHVPDFADRDKLPAGQGATQGWTCPRSVADHSNVVVVADTLFLCALDDKVLKEAVDRIGDALRFCAALRGLGVHSTVNHKRLFERLDVLRIDHILHRP